MVATTTILPTLPDDDCDEDEDEETIFLLCLSLFLLEDIEYIVLVPVISFFNMVVMEKVEQKEEHEGGGVGDSPPSFSTQKCCRRVHDKILVSATTRTAILAQQLVGKKHGLVRKEIKEGNMSTFVYYTRILFVFFFAFLLHQKTKKQTISKPCKTIEANSSMAQHAEPSVHTPDARTSTGRRASLVFW